MTPSEDKARPIEAQGHDDIAASLPDQARELLRGARKLVGGAIGIDADHAFRTLSAIDAFLAGQPAPPVSIGEKLTATVETAFRAYIARTSPLLSEHGIARTWEHFREHLEAAEKAARSPRVVTGEPWPFSIPSVEQGGSRLGPCDAFRSSADAREICGVCGFRAHAHRGVVAHVGQSATVAPSEVKRHAAEVKAQAGASAEVASFTGFDACRSATRSVTCSPPTRFGPRSRHTRSTTENARTSCWTQSRGLGSTGLPRRDAPGTCRARSLTGCLAIAGFTLAAGILMRNCPTADASWISPFSDVRSPASAPSPLCREPCGGGAVVPRGHFDSTGATIHRGPLGGIVSHEPPFTKLVPIDEPTHPGALIVGCIPDDEEAPVVESPNAQEDDMAHLTAAMVMAIRGMIARGLTPKEGVGKISEALMKAVDAALPLGAAPVGVSNAEPPKR